MEIINSSFSWILEIFHSLGAHIAGLFEPAFWMALLQKYQYWVVIIGALVEGETVLILAGAAAYYGLMQVHLLILIAFLGAVLHDNVLFFVGRFVGQKFFEKNPKIFHKIEKIISYILKYNTYFILGFRFVYGIRTVTPLVIGNSPVKFYRYAVLVSISSLIWATIVVYFGYSSALALENLVEDFDRYRKYLAFGVALLVVGVLSLFQYRRRRRKT